MTYKYTLFLIIAQGIRIYNYINKAAAARARKATLELEKPEASGSLPSKASNMAQLNSFDTEKKLYMDFGLFYHYFACRSVF